MLLLMLMRLLLLLLRLLTLFIGRSHRARNPKIQRRLEALATETIKAETTKK